jgi:hypothetical protein
MISVLAERSATVFHLDAAEPPSRIWVVRFSLDNKYIATGSSQGHINVVKLFLFFSGLPISMQHLRYGKLVEDEFVLLSNIDKRSDVSTYPLMAAS